MELENVKYDAFISYRHSPVDMYIAKSIHRRLESFKLPKSVIEKKLCTKTKIDRVFRDQDELPLADNLSDPIDNALSNTDFLIVICTPRLPQSKWCLKEITTFLKTHDRDHILVVLAEGEPYESFPYELTHEKITTVDADGNTVVEEREIEPLAADVRGKNKRETEKLLDDATLRLCAAIFGLNYDDLKQRHKEQQNKRRIKIAAGIAAVSLAFAAVCLFLFAKIKVQNNQILEQNEQITQQNEQITEQNETISQQYDEIQEKYQSAMVSCSSELFDKGRRKDSLYALTNGVDEKSITSDTAYMLAKSLYAYEVGQGYYASDVYENANGIRDTLLSTDGRYLGVIDDMGSINVFDTETDEKIASVANAIDDVISTMVCAFDDEDIYYQSENELHRFNVINQKDEILSDSYSQIWNNSGFSGVFSLADGVLYHYSADGSDDYSISLTDYTEEGDDIYPLCYLDDYAFSPDNETMAMFCYIGVADIPYVFVIDVPSGNIRSAFEAEDSLYNRLAVNNNTLYLSQSLTAGDISIVYGIDINTTTQNWYSFVESDNIRIVKYDDVNNRVIGSSFADIFALDGDTGELLIEDSLGEERFLADTILKVLVSNGQVDVFTNDGSRYCMPNGSYGLTDVTYLTYLGDPPLDSKVVDIVGSNNNLYISVEHSNLVTKYSYISLGEKISDISQDEYEEMTAMKGTDIASTEYNVVNAICSEDGEYIFTLYVDGSIVVTDKSGDVVNTIYNFEGSLVDVDRIDELGVYVLNSYSYSFLLDKDMNIVASMRTFVKYEDDEIYVTTGSALYKVPYTSPEKLLRQAKEEIGDYESDEATKTKYGIR